MTFTTISQIVAAVSKELLLPPPAHCCDYPYICNRTEGMSAGMGHRGSGRGQERRYWVRLLDGRSFKGTKAQLFEWAALHLGQGQEVV
jgi:hypothetical protein